MRAKNFLIGITVTAFGLGSLLATLLPRIILVCLLAAVITATGILLFLFK